MADRDLSSLSHLDAARLSRIWPGEDDAPAAALRRLLAVPLAALAQPPGAGHAPDAGAAPADAGRVGPATVGELLAHAAPSLELLRQVKDWARPAMTRDDPELPRQAAGVLYFAAIVAARARAGEWITDLPYEHVRQGARWALGRPWLGEPMAGLFRESLAALEGPTPPAE
jgi:hypothetical protein